MSSSSSPALNSIYDAENNTLTDLRDGQVYKTVTIGLQVWMAENLNYLPKDTVGTYFGGHSVCGGGEYKSLQEGDCSIFGRLYDVIIMAYDGYNKNLCPDGWKIPANAQWEILIDYLGNDNAGQKMKFADEAYWPSELATNESGFSAIPSGYYSRFTGFNKVDSIAPAVYAIKNSNSIQSNAVKVSDSKNNVLYQSYGEAFYIAIRCIKE
ncbi:FISUMP domain-containing protein [uncultured Fibrobacter sp.]|uniref:FISUMP domain-containing protein n=1 Tax=uncultured Fibrobacter sp. TaxID=261512 RepID=UPI0025E61C1A|nr:FISUMP domain-containing protein [uncultured Fibrobacter sp.]